jgi:hypothetical protein
VLVFVILLADKMANVAQSPPLTSFCADFPIYWYSFFKKYHKNIANVIMIILIQTSLVYVLLNDFRPLLGEQNIFNTNRIEQYLRPVRTEKNNYINAAKFVAKTECKNIGLSLSTMEYPWWILLNKSHQVSRIEHINVKNISSVKDRFYPYKNFIPCAIISVDSAQSEEIYTAG